MKKRCFMKYWGIFFKQNCGTYMTLILGFSISYYLLPLIRDKCGNNSFHIDNFKQFKDKIISKLEDDYEPRINHAGKPQKAKKIPKNLVRPRYYSSELGIREKLFVGVLTSGKTIRTNAVALNRTASHIVDKMMFFIDAKSAEKANVITLKLPGIVGSIDSQKILQPFHMLKYMMDNFLEEYDFFFIIRDSSYINAELLMKSLRKISVSQDVHVGGLKTGNESSFCTIESGILLSNSLLRKMQPSLDWCVKNAFSSIDDDNVGRCILHATNLPCKNTVQEVFFRSIVLPAKDQIKVINSFDLPFAVTYHQIFNPQIFYTLHYHIMKKFLKENNIEVNSLKEQININSEGLSWPPGSYPPKTPNTRFDLIRWDYFNQTTLFFPTSTDTLKPLIGADALDAQNVVNASVKWLMDKYKWEIKFKTLVNGYRRFDPSRGLDYILDLSFKDLIGKETVKRVEVCKPLGKVEVLGVPYVTENGRVNLILPVLSETKGSAIEFMKNYDQICMASSELTFLLLILLYEPDAPGKGHKADIFKDVKDLALSLSSKQKKIVVK